MKFTDHSSQCGAGKKPAYEIYFQIITPILSDQVANLCLFTNSHSQLSNCCSYLNQNQFGTQVHPTSLLM